MKTLVVIFMLSIWPLGISGCGAEEKTVYYPESFQDVGLETIAAEFKVDMESRDVKIKIWPKVIRYSTRPVGQAGLCTYGPSGDVIDISPNYLHLPNELKTLVYHELGHCALGLQHESEPNHIMSTELARFDDFDAVWPSELDRLADHAKGD